MSAHIAYLGIAGNPVRTREVEHILIGSSMDDQALNDAAGLARSFVSDDMEDVHATVDYRRALTAELTKRVLKAAWGRREH